MIELGRTAHLLAMRPPLAFGGHCFLPVGASTPSMLTPDSPAATRWWWCVGCHQACPVWAIREGFATTMLGRWCVGLFKMLGPAP